MLMTTMMYHIMQLICCEICYYVQTWRLRKTGALLPLAQDCRYGTRGNEPNLIISSTISLYPARLDQDLPLYKQP